MKINPDDDNRIRRQLLVRTLLVLLPLLISAHMVSLWKGGITSVEARLAVYEVVQHFQGMLALTLLWCVWPTVTMASRSRVVLMMGIIIVLLSWAGHEFWLDWQDEWQIRQYISDLLAVMLGVSLSRWLLRPAPVTDWAEILKEAKRVSRVRAENRAARSKKLWTMVSRLCR